MLQPIITEVKPVKPFSLLLTYETREIKLFDVRPYIMGS